MLKDKWGSRIQKKKGKYRKKILGGIIEAEEEKGVGQRLERLGGIVTFQEKGGK